jgi:hypothetical protein
MAEVEPRKLFIEIILLAAICGLISGTLYYYRTEYLELSSIQHNIFRAVRMTILYLIIPIFWLIKVRKMCFADMGIAKKDILRSTILGIGVYAIALAVFIILMGNPEFDRYFLWSSDMPAGEFALTMGAIAWMAALTDIWTRGMILMPVFKLKGLYLAILTQNIFWLASHIYELSFLAPSMTLAGALALTLSLGILGDIVAIKTKNIIHQDHLTPRFY